MTSEESGLTHLDAAGHARMVDVGAKPVTQRMARAEGRVRLQSATLALILSGSVPKGDVLAAARIAGIMAAKRTSEVIPLCHGLALSSAAIEFSAPAADQLLIRAEVHCSDRTGVEMEALHAVSVAALTIYDMCKAVDKTMVIDGIRLIAKRGGRSGDWQLAGDDGSTGSAA
jgi:cyclic pyranopterin monophosphate synthase